MTEAKLQAYRDRLIARRVVDANGCWIFNGCHNDDGYGQMAFFGRSVSVHRVMYILAHGSIPVGTEVCHSCDVRGCFNPDHLFAATHNDNIRDATSKKRMRGGNYGKTHCKRGHPLSGSNVAFENYGARKCRTCRILKMRARSEARGIPRTPSRRRPLPIEASA